jgi:hypothetical protein
MSRTGELTHLFRALKAPAAARAMPKLAERARAEEWSYERFAEALLSTETASRETSGGKLRIAAARFPPARRSKSSTSPSSARSRSPSCSTSASSTFSPAAKTSSCSAPAPARPTLAIALGIRACLAEAANLMFMLVASRYEQASLIVRTNKTFSAWGEIFGDEVVAAVMIDRLVQHAEILALKGDSYRLRDKDLGPAHPPRTRSTDLRRDPRRASCSAPPSGLRSTAPAPRYPGPFSARATGSIFSWS